MERINGLGGSAARSFLAPERSSERAPDAAAAGRALVSVQPIERHEHPSALSRRPTAAFLAHLIATQQDEPQTRDRRRAKPAEAMAAYDGTKVEFVASGRGFRRLA